MLEIRHYEVQAAVLFLSAEGCGCFASLRKVAEGLRFDCVHYSSFAVIAVLFAVSYGSLLRFEPYKCEKGIDKT